MTLIVIGLVLAAAAALGVWNEVAYRRELRRIPTPTVEPSQDSHGDLLGSDLDTWIAAQRSGR